MRRGNHGRRNATRGAARGALEFFVCAVVFWAVIVLAATGGDFWWMLRQFRNQAREPIPLRAMVVVMATVPVVVAPVLGALVGWLDAAFSADDRGHRSAGEQPEPPLEGPVGSHPETSDSAERVE